MNHSLMLNIGSFLLLQNLLFTPRKMQSLALPIKFLIVLVFGALIVGKIPFCTLGSVVWIISGQINNFSIILIGLLLAAFLGKVFNINQKVGRLDSYLSLHFNVLVVMVGGLLYLSTLDFIDIDLYRLGIVYYSHNMLISLLCVTVIYGVFCKRYLSVLLVAAFLGYQLHVLSSINLFDYFLDPLLWVLCLYILIIKSIKVFQSMKG